MYSVTRVFRTVEVPFLRVELDLKAPAGCRSARAGSYTDSEHPSLSLWRLSGRTYNFFLKKIEEHRGTVLGRRPAAAPGRIWPVQKCHVSAWGIPDFPNFRRWTRVPNPHLGMVMVLEGVTEEEVGMPVLRLRGPADDAR